MDIPRGVFMHLCMKIPRHTSKNPIATGDFIWIFARNGEGTEQLLLLYISQQVCEQHTENEIFFS